MEPDLDIIYRDEYFVAVHKPEGLLVHKSNIDKHETVFLLQELRNQIGQHLYPVHRLDKPTSGLILFALTPDIAKILQAQMQDNTASKEYLLVCRGYCEESGEVDHPLKPMEDFKRKSKKVRDPKPAQDAVTQYRRLQTVELNIEIDKYPTSRYSLVLAKLLTGRKHQLRRHFKHLSHPIIGCPKHGKSPHNSYFAAHLGAPRLLLHSYRMHLHHPVTKEPMTLLAPPQGSFKALLELLWPDINRTEPCTAPRPTTPSGDNSETG